MEEHRELRERIQDLIGNSESLANLKTKIMNKRITILLGQTRSGKSTLANYLLDNYLTSVKSGIGKSYKLETVNADGGGPQIRNGPLSVTSISTVKSTRDGGILIDSPGFEDNRGIPQDIFNAVSVSHIRFADSIKFVLVCYIGNIINDNVHNFTNLLKQIADLVPNIEEINNSVCIIFTKDERDFTLDDLTTVMRDISNENGLVADKRLLSTWIENKDLIGIFKAPVKEGGIDSNELEVNVKNAINACNYVKVRNLEIKFALAERSTILLRSLYPYYTVSHYFESEIRRLIGRFKRYFEDDQNISAANGEELTEVQRDLQHLNIHIRLLPDIIHNLEALKVSLEELMNVRNLNLSPEFESHFQFILSLDNAELFEENCRQDVIRHYKISMKILYTDIQRVLGNITFEFNVRKRERINSAGGGLAAMWSSVTGTVAAVDRAAVAAGAATGTTVAVTFGSGLADALFNAAGGDLAAMWSSVTGTVAAVDGAATGTTVAVTSVIAATSVTVGVVMGFLYWTIRNSFINRPRARALLQRDRPQIEE